MIKIRDDLSDLNYNFLISGFSGSIMIFICRRKEIFNVLALKLVKNIKKIYDLD